jgi:hypothetical protein
METVPIVLGVCSMSDSGKSSMERERQALLEYFKLSHDSQKHLTTLTAGSIVLISTFLKDIFPKTKNGTLLIGMPIKVLIAVSFICFGCSLLAATWLLGRYSTRTLEVTSAPGPDFGEREVVRRIARATAFSGFWLGLAFFGLAVLANLF